MTESMSWAAAEGTRPLTATLLHAMAAVLMTASEMVARLAERQAVTHARRTPLGLVEFHAIHRDAGAPEGALYVDGHLVGVLEGVTRL